MDLYQLHCFFCVGVLYDRMHTRRISDYGGVANSMPIFAAFFMLFALANTGLPGTSGFVGEFFVILSSIQANFIVAALAALTMILGASYTLWMYRRVVFGTVQNSGVAALQDIDKKEILIMSLLALMVILLGIWPNSVLEISNTSAQHLVDLIMAKG